MKTRPRRCSTRFSPPERPQHAPLLISGVGVQTTGDRTDGSVALLLLGAGSGVRLGQPLPKALVEVDGQPLLAHALAGVARAAAVSEVVVTAPAAHLTRFEEVASVALRDAAPRVVAPAGNKAGTLVAAVTTTGLARDRACGPALRVVTGGVARSDSVAVALQVLSGSVDLVLVHDVARAFAPASLIHSVIAALRSNPRADAVVPALPVTDTIKVVDLVGGHGGHGGHGDSLLPDTNGHAPNRCGPAGDPTCGPTDKNSGELVVATLDRNALRAAQTPQGFRLAALEAALHDVGARREATDDADLVARNGGKVLVIPGAAAAFKITHAFDLLIAEAVCADRRTHEYALTAGPDSPGPG